MPNLSVLSRVAAADKYKLASTAPWLPLVDFCWQGQHVRFVRNTDAVTFDAGDGLGPQTYNPLAFELVGTQIGTDGSLTQTSLKVSNVARMVEGAIVQYQGAVGATANIYVLNTDNPAGEPELALQTTILKTTTTAAWVTFTLSAPSPLRMLFPKYLYYQGMCMWQYKGMQCGYSGSLVTCDMSFDGANGCLVHANQQRYGAFPGISTNGASIAGQI